MPLPIFNPDPAPSPGTTLTPEVRLHEAPFGDGYTQAGPRGLNHIKRTAELHWQALTPAQAQALTAFFEERGGFRNFRYTAPGDTTERRWTCKRWSSTSGAPHTFAATLEESFTLEN